MEKIYYIIHLTIGIMCMVEIIEVAKIILVKKSVKKKILSFFVLGSAILLLILYIPMAISGEINSYLFLFGAYILLSAISNKNNIDWHELKVNMITKGYYQIKYRTIYFTDNLCHELLAYCGAAGVVVGADVVVGTYYGLKWLLG